VSKSKLYLIANNYNEVSIITITVSVHKFLLDV